MNFNRFTFALLATTLVATPALSQDSWNWRKAVAAGKTLEIKGINGDIRAVAATGNEVEVLARKSARRSDLESVTIKVVEHAGGVTICAMYPTPRGKQENECQPGRGGRMNNNNNDVEVVFEVRVPRGVAFTGRTVNGSIRATGMTADVVGTTVNGSVRVATTGLAGASTVNGEVDVTMGRANWSNELDFSTVNGSITLTMPENVSADVEASTVNGSFDSDWPMTVRGKFGPKRIRGQIGTGGRELTLSTVNGNIDLRKSN